LDFDEGQIVDDVGILISTMEGQLNDAALVLDQYEDQKRKALKLISDRSRAQTTHRNDVCFGLMHIYARYFIYALVIFGKCLSTIKELDLLAGVGQIDDTFGQRLKPLKEIRDSMMHIEDRARGFGRPGKQNRRQAMRLQNNILMLGTLSVDQDRFECTGADGHLWSVEIGRATLDAAVTTLQDLINILPWRGFPCGRYT